MANTTGKKFGGRKKGTPNKTTNELRAYFNLLLNDNLEQINNDLKALEPKERLTILLKLSEFIIPKLKATEISSASKDSINPIVITLSNGTKDN